MRKWMVRLVLFVLAFLLAAGGYSVHYLQHNVPVGTSYFAKIICSSVFVSGRDRAGVLAADLALDNPLVAGISVDVDREARQVSVGFHGFFKRIAVFRDGLGCTLANGFTPGELREQAGRSRIAEVLASSTEPDDSLAWPDGTAAPGPPPQGIDAAGLGAALDDAFSEPDPERLRRTRAVESGDRPWPQLPGDAYFMSGFEGQMVAVVPSKSAVVVRLGLSKSPTSWNRTEFLAGVLAALP